MSRSGLNILMIARYADRRGGADVYTEALATQLAQRCNNVSLLCHSASKKVHEACKVKEINEPNYHDVRALWRFAPLFYQRHWRQAINRFESNSPDVIISSMPLSSEDLRRRFPETPLVYLPHSRIAPVEATDIESGSRVQRSVARRLYAHWEKWSLIHAAKTVRFTAGNEQMLRSYYDLPVETGFHLIPASVEFIDAAKQSKTENPIRLVSVGRLVESKNLLWLIQQMPKLNSIDWHWTIAGDGPQRSELESAVARFGIEEQVTFLGFCEDVSAVYRSADLQLFPSKRESLGLVILEAMAFGVPTLAFEPDGNIFQTASDEIVQHGVDGILAKSESEFFQLIDDSIADPQQLLEFGETGRQKVQSHHSWEKVSARWQDLLNSLANRHCSRPEQGTVYV